MCDWDVDPNVFIIRLMRQVLERRNIRWNPGRSIFFDPQPYRREDGYLENHILQICIALEKLSGYEYQWDVEEFELLHINLGTSDTDFVDFFTNCVSTCFLTQYSPFNFLRYLRYMFDFSVFCYIRGFRNAVNQAVISTSMLVHANAHEFKHLENWTKVIEESQRIIHSDLRQIYAYHYNVYRI